MPGAGSATPKLLLIGEAPGAKEDEQRVPFVGHAGSILDKLLDHVGLNRSDDTFITNVVKCHPPENRDPEPPELLACHPYLVEQLAILRPSVIVTMGAFAAQEILSTSLPISDLRQHVWKLVDSLVVPTFHPMYATYGHWDVLFGDFELVAAVLAGEADPDGEAAGWARPHLTE